MMYVAMEPAPEFPDLTVCEECDGTGTAPPETGPGLTGRPLTCLACDGDGHLTD